MTPPSIYIAKAEGARPAPKLPEDAVTRTFGIFGMKDSGKTTTARVLAEGIVKLGGNVVIFDPVGVWWGITRAGEGSGVPGIVLGGEHGDVPLRETGGQLVAELAVARQWPVVVVDLKLLRKGAAQRFLADCLEGIYFANRLPLHIIFEEADRALPQSPRGMDPTLGRVLGAAEDIVKLGRSRGLGSTFISQRFATVQKNVTEQIEALLLHRQVGPNDRKAVKLWIESNGDPKATATVLDSMASLAQGEAWLYSPGWLRVLERVRMKMPKTLDSSSTPTNDALLAQESAARAPVDLDELRRLMAETEAVAAANDPKALRARIADLERRLDERPSAEPERIVVPDRAQVVKLTEAVAALDGADASLADTLAIAVDQLRDGREALEAALRPIALTVRELSVGLDALGGLPAAGATSPRAEPVRPGLPAHVERGDPSRGAAKLYARMRELAPLRLSRTQLATLLRRGAKSSTLTEQLAELKAAGLIDDRGGWHVTARGDHLSDEDTLARWRAALPAGPLAVFDVLLRAGEIDRGELFRRAGFSPTSSTPGDHLKLLRDNDLATVRNGVVRLGPAVAFRSAAVASIR